VNEKFEKYTYNHDYIFLGGPLDPG